MPVHCNPLAGIDAEEIFDAGALAADLRQALRQRAMAANLSAKVAVAIDGGGPLDLANLVADIRLGAQAIDGSVALRVRVGGDAASASDLGVVAPEQGVEAALRLLEVLSRHGRAIRARDVVASEGAAVFRAAIGDLLKGEIASRPASRSYEAIGPHRLRDGSLACGVGLAFGHADAASLQRLAEAAAAGGAKGLCTAPGRALLAIGLRPEATQAFAAAAEQLGFIVRADDPRRHVVACAGAPICAAAHIASRALAPLVATQTAAQLGSGFTVHISGCAKGCAQAAAATLTVVGGSDGCALIADGSVRDRPFTVVATDELPAAIAKFARAYNNGAGHV